MYHRRLGIFIATQNQAIEKLLQGVLPLERFSHEFCRRRDLAGVDLKKFQILVLDFDCVTPDVLDAIGAAKENQAVVVGCFSPDHFSILSDHYPLFDQVWIQPLAPDKVAASFTGILNTLKAREDARLTHKYLDTLIDSLPDLIWFKDARGAHLKINDSFCRAVSKTKAQIEGRGHYYIWDLEPDEYAQGEYICLESEEIVLNKKETCLFDETVKCGDELRKFKTYKSPIFDDDGSVIGTVGLARDVTDLQNLLIELNILIQSMPFPVVIMDKARVITSVNQRFLDIFMIDRKTVLGRPIDTLLDETQRVTLDKKWTLEKDEGSTRLLSENRILKIQEETLLDIFGNPAGYIQLFMDTTLEYRLREEKEKLENAIEEIKQLSGLLPICSSCKKVRDDKGYWEQIESYIETHTEAVFSHGLCPHCMEDLYGNEAWYIKKKGKKER